MLPYEKMLRDASATGRILKRGDIYGSGPPVDELSGDAQAMVREYCSGSVVDLGAGCGALQRYLAPSVAYLGIEINPLAVQMARERGRNVIWGDANNSGLRDGSVEGCTMFQVL